MWSGTGTRAEANGEMLLPQSGQLPTALSRAAGWPGTALGDVVVVPLTHKGAQGLVSGWGGGGCPLRMKFDLH